MDAEKSKKGKALEEELNRVALALSSWGSSQKLTNDNRVHVCVGFHFKHEYLPASPETFTIVKALNVAYFTDRLNELQTEFDNL